MNSFKNPTQLIEDIFVPTIGIFCFEQYSCLNCLYRLELHVSGQYCIKYGAKCWNICMNPEMLRGSNVDLFESKAVNKHAMFSIKRTRK